MTVFKGYLLIIRRNLGMILMYISIFVGVSIMIQKSYLSTGISEGFTAMKLNVAVIDRDQGLTGETLRTMLAREHNLVELADDEQQIQEALYYGDAEYVLIIPEGAKTFQSIAAPDSCYSFYVESQVNMLLNQIHTFESCGSTEEEACSQALALGEKSGTVTLVDVNGNAGVRPAYNYYFGYMPYAFLGASIMSISLVIIEFKKKEIRRRMESSAVPFLTQNFAAAASFLLVGGLIWGLCILIHFIMYGKGIFGGSNTGYYLLNSLACMLVALSLGYFSGMIVNAPIALNGLNNVLSLGLCFLGGVFVPLEMIGGGLEKAARFLPTYWYSRINGILGDYAQISGSTQQTVFMGLMIQFLFAAACFAVTLVIRKMRLRNNG